MSAVTDKLESLELIVAGAVATVESAKTLVIETESNIEQRIADAVLISENETIVPLANSVTNSMKIQTLFINLLNQ
jgi:hypothetical protein